MIVYEIYGRYINKLNVFDITMFRNMSDIAITLRIISTILHYSKDDKMRPQKP